ncbi:MAG: hypF [Anaerolineales bacterium]|nr:hypF [Anaerolineales bacterium]
MSLTFAPEAGLRTGRRLRVRGLVQGVGFRPFIYNLALRLELDGWVRNTSSGVEIEVSGPASALEDFRDRLGRETPPLARIDQIEVEPCHVAEAEGFRILPSLADADGFQLVPADVATCPACLSEIFDPANRRYRYPFTNCTHCGPRLTIIESMPYDRPGTTMAGFAMCPACAAEYNDPADRRFHAQPIACPDCGPSIWLEVGGERIAERDEALRAARLRLTQGQSLAVRGLGGFHLACDAADEAAVNRLRARKGRGDKPFAVMFADLAEVERAAIVGPAERQALQRRDRPIVVVERGAGAALAASLAPGQHTIGALLPYTPLHHLLLERADGFPTALVMTSGNRSEEPIAADLDEARGGLADIADGFLMHDRPIHQRCDDSVQRLFRGADLPLRRARGRVPDPVELPGAQRPLLAVGAELKNTFCLARDGLAFLGPHIGDLHNDPTLDAFERSIAHFERLFRVRPEQLACDRHPDYLATRYAEARAEAEGLVLVRVQHHHAHIAACLAEVGASPDEPVIGIAFDGTGWGDDGAAWGGEVLLADLRAARRLWHLAYVPLPGGDAAVRSPWRMALAWLDHAGEPWSEDLACVAHATEQERLAVRRMVARDALSAGLVAPPTSSVGRLFDAVAALIGVRQEVRDEAQAAVELEALADPSEHGSYAFAFDGSTFDASPVIRELVVEMRQGVAPPILAARFHNAVAAMVGEVCLRARQLTGVHRVALSGGVWQNLFLLERTVTRLEQAEFDVLLHRRVPANDGGVALGQAAVAAWQAQSS